MRGTLHQGLHCKHGSPEQGRWLSANLNRQFFRTAVVAPCREMDMGLLDQVFGGTQAGISGRRVANYTRIAGATRISNL
jgi:hypothetical protein